MFVLVEFATGYTLFEKKTVQEIGLDLIQESITDFGRFAQVVSLKSFAPFKSAQHALQEINSVSESICSDYLKQFLELNKVKELGVGDAQLGGSIKDHIKVNVHFNEVVRELVRGIRVHAETFLKQLKKGFFV
jgi:nucleolar protein 56